MGFPFEQEASVLRKTPAVLRTMLQGLDPSWTDHGYGPCTWSPKEVLAHLIFGDRSDWIPRITHIMSVGAATPFAPFDRAGHADLYLQHSLPELLELFERERSQGLAALSAMGITARDTAREGRHPALGIITLAQLVSAWVVHDLNHIAQVAKGMAHQRRALVGPFEAYLSILAPPNPR